MTSCSIGPLLHEGKAKRVHATDHADLVAVHYKDDTTAFNAAKKASLTGKGQLNCRIAALLFEHLERQGIASHYRGLMGDDWMICQRLRVIPLEVVVRNRAAGSLCRQMPIAEGTPMTPPLIDLYYKDDAYGDPLLSEARLMRLAIVDADRLEAIRNLALVVNQSLGQLFAAMALELVDFKIEIGLTAAGQLLLADEISPDTCRLWDRGVLDRRDRILDKDRFRQDLGGVLEAYREVLKRVQGVCPEPRVYG